MSDPIDSLFDPQYIVPCQIDSKFDQLFRWCGTKGREGRTRSRGGRAQPGATQRAQEGTGTTEGADDEIKQELVLQPF